MKQVWQTVRRLAIVLLATTWLQTVSHTVACHSGHDADEHGDCSESIACSCVCHTAIEPSNEAPVCVEHRETAWVPASNETVRVLLLPDDIFRPPLAVS